MYFEKSVDKEKIEKLLDSKGFKKSKNPEFVLALGGDGTFLRAAVKFRKSVILPIRVDSSIGSLIKYSMDDLPRVLDLLKENMLSVKSEPLLECDFERRKFYSAGDFYFQRGRENQAVRYYAKIKTKGKVIEVNGIGDGLIVTTPIGSTGYFGYVERIKGNEVRPISKFGFEHILPYKLEQSVNGKSVKPQLRILLEPGFLIEVQAKRCLDQCIYSSSFLNKCVAVRLNQKFVIKDSGQSVKIII